MARTWPDQGLDNPDGPYGEGQILNRSGLLGAGTEEGQEGFTLLEMLLALLLLAVITVSLTTTFNLLVRSRRVQNQTLELNQQLRYAYRVLHAGLSSAASRLNQPGPWPYFIGTQQESQFLSQAPLEVHNLGGIWHWRLRLGRNEAGQLCLFAEVGKAINWLAEPKQVETRIILLQNLKKCHFSYGLGRKEFSSWLAQEHEVLPDWVKISFVLENQPPQAWIFPLYVKDKRPERS